jgi:hypothetical protein
MKFPKFVVCIENPKEIYDEVDPRFTIGKIYPVEDFLTDGRYLPDGSYENLDECLLRDDNGKHYLSYAKYFEDASAIIRDGKINEIINK